VGGQRNLHYFPLSSFLKKLLWATNHWSAILGEYFLHMRSLLFFLYPQKKKKGRGEKKQNMPPTDQIDIHRELLTNVPWHANAIK
jgi:hypothetical protein